MKRLFVLCCFAAVTVIAAERPAHHDMPFGDRGPAPMSVTRDGQTIDGIPSADGPVALIVEFREPPLFAKRGATTLQAAASRADTFQRDLARIHRDMHSKQLATDSVDSPPRITHTYSRVYSGASVVVDASEVRAITQLGYVAGVHLDRVEHAFLDKSVPKINADKVWATYGTRGAGIVVAIIDTGIDYNHPPLGGGFGAGHRVIGGHDFINNDDDPMDDYGHGTHVAGIVGGNGGGILGVAPDVQFLAYKVLDATGSGD